MKKLLNTLYVTTPESYLSLDGENVVIFNEGQEMGRIPLHNLEAIVSFGYRGVSPALMGGCAKRNISLCFLTPQGKYLARVTGGARGNVLLRKSSIKFPKNRKPVWKYRKILYWERCIIAGGFWNGPFVTILCKWI